MIPLLIVSEVAELSSWVEWMSCHTMNDNFIQNSLKLFSTRNEKELLWWRELFSQMKRAIFHRWTLKSWKMGRWNSVGGNVVSSISNFENFIGSKIRHIRGNEKMRGKSAREENWEKFMGSCAFLALVSIVIYLTITIKHFCELWIFLQMRFLISLADFSLFIDFNLVSLFSAFLYKLRQWTKYGNCLRDFLCSLNCRLSCSSRLKIWISIFFRGCE